MNIFICFKPSHFLSCFSLYKASRELASLKVIIFVYYLRLGGKLNLNSINNIFDVIDTVDDAEIKGYLERLFDLYRENILLIENFYEYDEGDSAINVVDLMEGAAYTFQKLMNRSTEINTFTAEDDSCYKKAKLFFQRKGGSDDVLFLILSHMSLKYGLLDDGDFMEFMPTPQGIFEGLCENITEYEKSLNDIPLQISFFGTYSYADKLEKWGFNINSSELSLLKDISNIEDESLYAVGILVSIIRMVTAHVKEIYDKKGTKFKDASMVIDEPRASKIDSNIKDHFVEYDSDLFLPLLLVHNPFATEFFFKFLPTAKNATYKGLFDEDTSSMMDDNLYKLVDDVDFLLRHKVGCCCEEHGKIPYRDLINNNNENCLTRRVNSLIGVGLEGIIE